MVQSVYEVEFIHSPMVRRGGVQVHMNGKIATMRFMNSYRAWFIQKNELERDNMRAGTVLQSMIAFCEEYHIRYKVDSKGQ